MSRLVPMLAILLPVMVFSQVNSQDLAMSEQQRFSDLDRRPLHQLNNAELAEYLQMRHVRVAGLDTGKPTPRENVGLFAKRSVGQSYRLISSQFDLQESDCVVLVNRMLAMSLASDWRSYYLLTERIRHKDGVVDYRNRNFFTLGDWLPNNAWLLSDITEKIGPMQNPPVLPFTHVVRPKVFEKAPSGRWVFKGSDYKSPDKKVYTDSYVTSERVPEVLGDLKTGDVVLILRKSAGGHLGCDHMGLILSDAGNVRILHSAPPSVMEEPLVSLLQRCNWVVGFKFLRLKDNAAELAGAECARMLSTVSVPRPEAQDEKDARRRAARSK